MKQKLETFLSGWPSVIIADRDIYSAFDCCQRQSLRDLINRATGWKWLVRVKRGLFVIGHPFKKEKPSRFELAQHIYGPSYISMESALSYHQLIPEAVHATVSMCANRKIEFDTPFGMFLYHHLSSVHFYEGVERIEEGNSVYLMATPLKALGDYLFVSGKEYATSRDLADDLRIDHEDLTDLNPLLLDSLIERYPSCRVQTFFRHLKVEIHL